MISSSAKIIAACFAVCGPFIAGLLIAQGLPLAATLIVGAVGIGVGLIGGAVFCAIDTAEEINHLRHLNPGLRLGGEG